MRRAAAILVAALALRGAGALALVAGGGPAASDCAAVWDGVAATRGATGVECRDGDPACDADGAADGACTFGVNVCVMADGLTGCTPSPVTALRVPKVLARAGGVVVEPLAPPPVPASAPSCGTAALLRLPLRGTRRPRASRRVRLRMRATTEAPGRGRRDKDRLTLRCLPNAGEGECPANPAGGPRELRIAVAEAGTDLDNGWLGFGHNFPMVAGSTLRACLSDCDGSTDPTCTAAADTGPGTLNGPAFGPPLPLFVIGVATCLVNRYDAPIAGATDLSTGAIDLDVTLRSEVWTAPGSIVCPQCSGGALGATGVCLDGPDKGRACRVEGTALVGEAGNQVFRLSSSCRPEGSLVARLQIPLHVTTGTHALDGSKPCPGQLADDDCQGGTCTGACSGNACVAQVPDPVAPGDLLCVDRKGGLSQLCCSNDTTRPCFPTGLQGGRLERAGRAAVPQPAWPDPAYPKTADPVLADVFCEPATNQNVLDAITTGLPGAAALILPVHACYRDEESCP